MKVLSFDPGTKMTGWAYVEVSGCPALSRPITATFITAGNISSLPDALEALMLRHESGLVAIEKLEGYAFGGRVQVVSGLVSSSNVAGIIRGLAHAHKRATVEMSATAWRKIVCGRGSATDAVIKTTVNRVVEAMPKRSNAHVRDAVGLALGASIHLAGGRR